jgi:hypothetical protein
MSIITPDRNHSIITKLLWGCDTPIKSVIFNHLGYNITFKYDHNVNRKVQTFQYINGIILRLPEEIHRKKLKIYKVVKISIY